MKLRSVLTPVGLHPTILPRSVGRGQRRGRRLSIVVVVLDEGKFLELMKEESSRGASVPEADVAGNEEMRTQRPNKDVEGRRRRGEGRGNPGSDWSWQTGVESAREVKVCGHWKRFLGDLRDGNADTIGYSGRFWRRSWPIAKLVGCEESRPIRECERGTF